MPDYTEQEAERDKSLGSRLYMQLDYIAMQFHTWLQEEVISLIPRLRSLADSTTAPDYEARYRMKTLADIEEMHAYEISAVMAHVKDRLKDAEAGAYQDVLRDYQDLLDALHGLERLVRIAIRGRDIVHTNWVEDQTAEAGEADHDG